MRVCIEVGLKSCLPIFATWRFTSKVALVIGLRKQLAIVKKVDLGWEYLLCCFPETKWQYR